MLLILFANCNTQDGAKSSGRQVLDKFPVDNGSDSQIYTNIYKYIYIYIAKGMYIYRKIEGRSRANKLKVTHFPSPLPLAFLAYFQPYPVRNPDGFPRMASISAKEAIKIISLAYLYLSK